ncbi:26S proteasome regulatory complex, non-ATPase subcomplex, Rpn2/Psmd1 subunit [Rozella allomycis CSF55]|uniref:26S proteasome regulatory subunit RPN2 n=1 Tax=Rozella allomycis (strain CSF55) TaxID=988480 RepID=A0A4P9YM76_ROZAC|nr:26S proteasome regulatory complex, non-ATPase subcomplex, Rpn2/Psmd1 subunit [Rozella allomycis CSF55]
MYEDEKFNERELAALVVSKVYFHLGAYDEALMFAMSAGGKFEMGEGSEYSETMILKGIDRYVRERREGRVDIDVRLVKIVERMFDKCMRDGMWTHAVGIAVESLRFDVVGMIEYVREIAMNYVEGLEVRNKMLEMCVEMYLKRKEANYERVGECLISLGQPEKCARVLIELSEGDEDKRLIGYQIGFNLYENASRVFLNETINKIREIKGEETKMITILNGDLTGQLYLEFLYRNNKTDLNILKEMQKYLEAKSSISMNGLMFSHAFMNAGTTDDTFLRNNVEWMQKASLWSKFSVTASLGVIHKGQVKEAFNILKPYLPQNGVAGSAYSEGGSLYALGLMSCGNYSEESRKISEYLMNALKNNHDETIKHGASLGIGLNMMGSGDMSVYEELKGIMYSDDAVSGEAAGISIGLIMMGTGNEQVIEEMIEYGSETQHEKIMRGIAVGIGLIMYKQEEKAERIIDRLKESKDPIMRYASVYVIGMSFVGSGNMKWIKHLLHVAVSDTSDDVRRVAIIFIGFLLYKNYEQVPKIIKLLSESFNPFVRFGSTLALGISCAGSNFEEALNILDPLTRDNVDYVKQGAFIAIAMICVQNNAKSKNYLNLFQKVIKNKYESPLSKFGASLASSILNIGGRNCNIFLNSSFSFVGLSLFIHSWFWFPLNLCLSLSFNPTCFIGLNKDLVLPNFNFNSKKLFEYPENIKNENKDLPDKIVTAILSTTAKAKARAHKKEKKIKGDESMKMDVEGVKEGVKEVVKEGDVEMKVDNEHVSNENVSNEHISNENLTTSPLNLNAMNFTRILPIQTQFISFDNSRFHPISKSKKSGIVLLKDKTPNQPFDQIKINIPLANNDNDNEPSPPEPFEYVE